MTSAMPQTTTKTRRAGASKAQLQEKDFVTRLADAGEEALQRLAELPVILVTALESREDKERGIEVGANAYVVKSSFDQSNLLDIIRRLV